ncbi:hypothetical protein Premu_2612 [Hallella multisaccharivorax DSM 17128]|uniref:Uncharacterized protein n=1 Tax=Hallella multisaccharivorax DSM 17128 TaxID=688246 RepID=F8NBK4_9BACT|nr:hypothetical protein Premu_2612 [Hallella multisaccharivorax DSM 17128]
MMSLTTFAAMAALMFIGISLLALMMDRNAR